jgi:hypothetical protein
LITESILAQSSEVITAPNGTAKNSDNTYSVAVPSGATVTMPDIAFTDSNGVTTSVPSNKNITAALCGAAASVGMKLMKTGQTVSYRTGDDGDLEAGRATSFLILASNNPFGNTNRFTDELGGTTYTNNIVIDWSTFDGSTVLGYYRLLLNTGGITFDFSWNAAIDKALTHSIGSFVSGWRLWNTNEATNIVNYAKIKGFNYSPFDAPEGQLVDSLAWTSTSVAISTVFAWFVGSYGAPEVQLKTNLKKAVSVRTFTVTGTTLS